MDERFTEARALVRTIAEMPEARRMQKGLAPLVEQALEMLAVDPDSPEADQAAGDVAAVLTAYQQAIADEEVSHADVRRILLKVRKLGARMDDTLSRGAAARQARFRLEEAVFGMALDRLPRPKPISRFHATGQLIAISDAKTAARRRRGIDAAHRAVGHRQGASLTEALRTDAAIDTRFPGQEAVATSARAAESAIDGQGDLVHLLMQAVDEALEHLPTYGANAAATPPASLVLAWGCLELVDAWRPNGTIATCSDNNPLVLLIPLIHEAAFPDQPGREFRDRWPEVVGLRNDGVLPLAFEGRYPRKRRIFDQQCAEYGDADELDGEV